MTAYAWSMHGGEKTRTKRHSTASDKYARSHLVFPVLCSLAVLGYSSPAPVHNHPGIGFIDSTRQPRVSELPNTSEGMDLELEELTLSNSIHVVCNVRCVE